MSAENGRDLVNGTFTIGDLDADDRLRIGGILYLEQKLDRDFEDIADDLVKVVDAKKLNISSMIRAMNPFLIALILQRNPDMPENDIERALMRLELEDYTDAFDKVKLFKSAKNVTGQEPATAKKRPRQPVKKKA
jgi:hypothetical protein